uniref:EXPERA domain-containing protein n=1 Tax=Glycine max TaxID=3847 RepID=I1L4E3_SOYBN
MEAHPYVPRDLHLPGYAPCFLSMSNILSVFASSSLLIVTLVWIFSGKEYSKGDSRYAGRDAGVVTVEGITAVLEGPASLLAVYAIATGKSYSYILQFAISLGQLYGTAVYYITAILEGDNFSTNSFYYYAYYIGANASWIVIPLIIAIRCWRKICAAFRVQGGQTKKPKVR